MFHPGRSAVHAHARELFNNELFARKTKKPSDPRGHYYPKGGVQKGRPNQYYICREIGNRNGASAQTGEKGAETKGRIVLYTAPGIERKNLLREVTNEIIKSRSPFHIKLLNLVDDVAGIALYCCLTG